MATPTFSFCNTDVKLPERFYAHGSPDKASDPKLITYNKPLAKELGLSLDSVGEQQLAEVFSGNQLPEGAEPIAQAYAGHQFAHFVPQLGDGRALLIGELLDSNGKPWDIQLKGSGKTPLSRRGDGKSSLGPVLREYIVSEAMYYLGVPTTRALAAITTGDQVYRETALPGAVFTRVAPSHIRVGTFQYFAHRDDRDGLKRLLNYAVNRHYPEIAEASNLALAFLNKVITAQASLVAKWLELGFIHGVMNTDNTAVGGFTIDYGPCAFMDEFDPGKVFSSIDRQGRYAYNNQPAIAHWNLARLADSLVPLVDPLESKAIDLLETELATFTGQFESQWSMKMRRKLGLVTEEEKDIELIQLWFEYLQLESQDYTLSFRHLADLIHSKTSTYGFAETTQLSHFLDLWNSRLDRQGVSLEEVKKQMNKTNPLFIPRNHQVERAIQQGLKGDYSIFFELNKVLENPFDQQPDKKDYAGPPQPHEEVTQTFCGT
ncbi:MAG: YdiU family protein [Pseudobdellovibrionaceae bacterium]|nr:YdiU family protein [Bdellovibrionales bacterium]USN47500.1 MAG: YdiU family protein [Pseudobdellovibrionaceae bacterium]